ncbi:hypothetical protein MMC13_006611 [Lambiella insularis]|nr:hypothetical protein [Lambiella insularis]
MSFASPISAPKRAPAWADFLLWVDKSQIWQVLSKELAQLSARSPNLHVPLHKDWLLHSSSKEAVHYRRIWGHALYTFFNDIYFVKACRFVVSLEDRGGKLVFILFWDTKEGTAIRRIGGGEDVLDEVAMDWDTYFSNPAYDDQMFVLVNAEDEPKGEDVTGEAKAQDGMEDYVLL